VHTILKGFLRAENVPSPIFGLVLFKKKNQDEIQATVAGREQSQFYCLSSNSSHRPRSIVEGIPARGEKTRSTWGRRVEGKAAVEGEAFSAAASTAVRHCHHSRLISHARHRATISCLLPTHTFPTVDGHKHLGHGWRHLSLLPQAPPNVSSSLCSVVFSVWESTG